MEENAPYYIPEPSEEPARALVVYYKVIKGLEFDNRRWDKHHFARGMAAATELLEACGSYDIAKTALEELSGRFDAAGLSWSFETVVKHIDEWLIRRGKKGDKQNRKRFFDALAQQRASSGHPQKGGVVTGGEIFGPLRDSKILPPGIIDEKREPNSGHGSSGKEI